jgi:hypothetical protein
MNRLPQELVDNISSYLSPQHLKNTLLLSQKFQYAAEQYSKAYAEFSLTEQNAAEFLSRYTGRRFRYLRNVSFKTSFPTFDDDDDDNDCRYIAEELKSIDQEFTRQITNLFSILKSLETAVRDQYGPGNIHLAIFTPTREPTKSSWCLHRMFASWRVRLLSSSLLPALDCVRHLTVTRGTQQLSWNGYNPHLRHLDLRVLLDLSSKLPNLSVLSCELGGDEWLENSFAEEALRQITQDWAGLRRDSRHDFAKALEEGITLPGLRHARLDFLHPLSLVEDIDQRRAMPNLTSPAPYDLFSSSLRILSYQLRTMTLCVVADETLFWPADNSTPSWPHLQHLNVCFHMTSPSGSWYFKGLPGIGATDGYQVTDAHYPPLVTTDDDERADYERPDSAIDGELFVVQYRIDPNEETIVPLLAAFAKAAALMPKLKRAVLWSPLIFRVWKEGSDSDGEIWDAYKDFDVSQVSKYTNDATPAEMAWGMAYTRPGEEAFDSCSWDPPLHCRQIEWKVARWRPDPELHNLFQNIGRFEHGEELSEIWTDEWVGEGLDYRESFERDAASCIG